MKKTLLIFIQEVILISLFLNIHVFSLDLNKSLIAYWSFDDSTAKDFSGNDYHGMLMNNPTPNIGVNGIGTCFHFQGSPKYSVLPNIPTGQYIKIPMLPLQNYTSFTISLWVKEDKMENKAGNGYIFFGMHSGRWCGIMNHDQNLNGDLFTTYAVGGLIAGENISIPFNYNLRNSWIFYSMTYDNGAIRGYINGSLVGTISQKVAIDGNYAGIATHYWNTAGEDRECTFFTGSIDEVMIFNTSLSSCEIEKLYHRMNFTDTIFTICKYDSVTLKADPTAVSYTWSSGDNAQFISASDSGKYSVIQTYQSGCKDTINYHVSLLEVPNLVVNSTVENQCKDSLKYFFADSGFIDYKWYHLPDSMLVCSSQTFSSNIDGSYYLVGISKTGCKIFSDQFSIKGLNIKNNLSLSTCDLQTIINFDSVSLLNHSNRKLYVKNNSDRIYFLKDLFLAHNVAFSIPESQFPKIIAPYDSVAIEVYYQPSVINSLERDTIILSDSCNHLSIPLVANSLKVEYRSPSSCDIPTNFNIGQYLSGLRLLVSVPYPNPATEAINFSIYNPDKEDISIEIFNIYNTSLLTVNKKSFRESALNQFKIDISILPSGVYYSNVKCNGNVVNFSFVVLK